MEERIIDHEEGRKIRVTRTAAGGVHDAVEDGTEAAASEEEVLLDLPEEEYDEDLVGLTPTQLQQALEQREREAAQARAERDKLLAAGDAALAEKDNVQAETCYVQALTYDPECVAARRGIWIARTDNFSDVDIFLQRRYAENAADETPEVRQLIREQVGPRLEAERAACREELVPLLNRVTAAQEKRRGAFAENRRYYRFRALLLCVIALLLAAGAGVAASYIVQTRSALPVIFTAVFGALALVLLLSSLPFIRKWFLAAQYCRSNEKLSSTEEGRRVLELQERLECIRLVMDDATDD